MTDSQRRRQKHRSKSGKYDLVNPCQCCGKSAGDEYQSHHDTDGLIADELICLCVKCHKRLDVMSGDEAIKAARALRAELGEGK